MEVKNEYVDLYQINQSEALTKIIVIRVFALKKKHSKIPSNAITERTWKEEFAPKRHEKSDLR